MQGTKPPAGVADHKWRLREIAGLLDWQRAAPSTLVAGMLKAGFDGRRGSMSTAFVVLAVGTGVVVIAIVIAVVLVVLLVTRFMRDREKRDAQERGEVRREVAQAEDRAGRAERDRNVAREPTERTSKMGTDR
jgi:uncharacterized membrane protein